MPRPVQSTVTLLLGDLRDGSRDALDALLPLVHDELLALAHRQRLRWKGDYTLGTTDLVHEAYLKLVDQGHINATSRTHFFAVASTAMRHILCNYARDRRALKRGGDRVRVTLDGQGEMPDQEPELAEDQAAQLVALDEALRRLEKVNSRRCRVVECRSFGGMTVEDTAAALGTSPRTVKREWAVAQAWLHREVSEIVSRTVG